MITLLDVLTVINIFLLFTVGVVWAERERKKLDKYDKVYKETYL